jgi:hypothetical protein
VVIVVTTIFQRLRPSCRASGSSLRCSAAYLAISARSRSMRVFSLFAHIDMLTAHAASPRAPSCLVRTPAELRSRPIGWRQRACWALAGMAQLALPDSILQQFGKGGIALTYLPLPNSIPTPAGFSLQKERGHLNLKSEAPAGWADSWCPSTLSEANQGCCEPRNQSRRATDLSPRRGRGRLACR